MPNWKEVLDELQKESKKGKGAKALDFVRRKYLKEIFKLTGRNTIAYYSGWLQKPGLVDAYINDKDKSALMLTGYVWYKLHTLRFIFSSL